MHFRFPNLVVEEFTDVFVPTLKYSFLLYTSLDIMPAKSKYLQFSFFYGVSNIDILFFSVSLIVIHSISVYFWFSSFACQHLFLILMFNILHSVPFLDSVCCLFFIKLRILAFPFFSIFKQVFFLVSLSLGWSGLLKSQDSS